MIWPSPAKIDHPTAEISGKNRDFDKKSKKNALFLKIFAKRFGSKDFLRTFAIPNDKNSV